MEEKETSMETRREGLGEKLGNRGEVIVMEEK